MSKQYIIVENITVAGMSDQVGQRLLEGYELYGNPFAAGRGGLQIRQAMIRQSTENKED